MFKSSYRSNRSLIIHPYRWNPDQYTVTVAVHKAVKRGVLLCSRGISMTYPDASLTLNVRVAQRENVVLIYCESVLLHQHVAQNPTPPCLHKHTSPHGLFFHTGGLHFSKTIQVKPLLYFGRMQDMWWAPVFNSVSRGGLICVCASICVETRMWEREIISICEFALTRLACGPLLWTQCKEMQSSSTGLVSKMSGMLTYAVLDVKYNNSVLLCVCVCVQALFSLVFQIRQEDAAYNKWKAVKWTKWHQVSFIGFEPCNSNHLLGGKSVREMCLGCEWFSHLFGNGRCLSLPNGKSTLVRY